MKLALLNLWACIQTGGVVLELLLSDEQLGFIRSEPHRVWSDCGGWGPRVKRVVVMSAFYCWSG